MGFSGWVMVGLIALVLLVSAVLTLYGRRRSAPLEDLVSEPEAELPGVDGSLDRPRS